MRSPSLACILSVSLAPGLAACSDDAGGASTTEQTSTGDGNPATSDSDTATDSPTTGDGDGDTITTGDGDGDTSTTDGGPLDTAECDDPDPVWIFCDDFESSDPLVGNGRYFEHTDDDGDFVVTDGAGLGGSRAMRGHFETGEVDAGSLKLAFGRNPNGYMDKGIRSSEDFREIWYRMYLRNEAGWTGDPAKLSRATSFVSADDWSQAMIAHLWGDGNEHLLVDPVSCVQDGQVVCQGYNDFGNMSWLGNLSGQTQIFSTALSDQWSCIEAHVKLDEPGMSDGVQEFWIDGQLEARREGLEFTGSFTEYGINAVFFENYWNDGSSQDQSRDFDNIVVSTQPIGCL